MFYTSYDVLRRCGVGIHYVDGDDQPYYNVWQALPHPIQTVPRSELTALVIVLRNAVVVAAQVGFYTDSEIANKYLPNLSRLANLWMELVTLRNTIYVELNLYWGPSHTDTDARGLGIAPCHFQEGLSRKNRRFGR